MMWIVNNNGKVIAWFINDRSMTKDEALELIGMEKQEQEKEHIDDPDYRFDGRDFWYDDLTVEPVTNEMGLYFYYNRVGSDEWVEKYDNARDAVIAANNDWRRMEEADRRTRSEFYVLKSAAETMDAPDAYDGEMIATWI